MVSFKFQKGEYLHVPSGARLLKLNGRGELLTFVMAERPLALMCLGHESEYCEVFYGGEKYMIEERAAYKMEKEDDRAR